MRSETHPPPPTTTTTTHSPLQKKKKKKKRTELKFPFAELCQFRRLLLHTSPIFIFFSPSGKARQGRAPRFARESNVDFGKHFTRTFSAHPPAVAGRREAQKQTGWRCFVCFFFFPPPLPHLRLGFFLRPLGLQCRGVGCCGGETLTGFISVTLCVPQNLQQI